MSKQIKIIIINKDSLTLNLFTTKTKLLKFMKDNNLVFDSWKIDNILNYSKYTLVDKDEPEGEYNQYKVSYNNIINEM